MYNLTTPQQNIWNLQKTFENTSISNLCGAVFWGRRIEYKIVEKALNKFIECQSGFRLQFHENNGVITQYISPYQYAQYPFIRFNSKQELNEYAQNLVLQPFEMIDKPMCRFVLFELNGMSGGLVCLNHLIADAWTFSLLAKGVYNLCLEFEEGTFSEYQIYDYTEYVNLEKEYFDSERCQKDKAYWTEVYSEKPEISPIKMINTPVKVPTAQRFTTTLTSEQTTRINIFCTENSVSQAVLFETAVFIYLSKVNSENKNITIGIPVLNRKSKFEKT